MLVSKYKVTRYDGTTSVDKGTFYASDARDAKEQHMGAAGIDKKQKAEYEPTLSAVEVEITRGGKYVGTDEMFIGKNALLMFYNTGTLVRAQFNNGPMWMTHSWLTFDRDDWEIDGE